MNLNASLGKQVTLRGIAADDAAGAVVAVEDTGRRVFIAGLARWDRTLRGKRVEVTGLLARRTIGPEPPVAATGQRFVVDGATWRGA